MIPDIATTTTTTAAFDLNNSSLSPLDFGECRNVHDVPRDESCEFVKANPDCSVESFIEYINFLYCIFEPEDQWIAITISIIWTLILFISLGVAATDFLCPALFMISKSLRMSQNVAGVTLIAFGNGSPDVFAAIAGMIQGRPELVIGALFGGACFVVMIVLGSIFSVKSFKLVPISFLRDITFYAISASWVFYLFVGPRRITLFDGIGLLLFYGAYVALVVCSRFFKTRKDKTKDAKGEKDDTHRIVFQGIRPDDDPTSGMVIMKKFILYDEDGTSEHAKIIAIDDNHVLKSSSRERGQHLKTGTASLATVSAKIAASRASAIQQQPPPQLPNGMDLTPMRVISPNRNSAPDIVIDDSESLLDGENNTPYSPYSTINQNTVSSILNGGRLYQRNLNQMSITANTNLNELTITSGKSVSICEDNNSIYDTITSVNRNMIPFSQSAAGKMRLTKRRFSTASSGSRWSLSPSTRLAVRRASREFLEKIIPIDATGWRHRNWGGRSMEVVKAPIRFFLLLTTPYIDIDPHAPQPEDGDEVDTVAWNKPLSALHCITGPIFAVYATGLGSVWFGPVPLVAIVFVLTTIVSFALIFTSKFETAPSYYKTYCSFLGFIVGVVWVYFISTEVVSNIRALGVAFNLSEPTIGMTILAVGNCLLDFISNVSIARKGFPRMAISACLGSPLLALLLGVGIPATIRTAGGSAITLDPTPQLVVIYIVIMSSLALTVIVAASFHFIAKRWYGITLIVLYFFVITVILLIEFQVFAVNFNHLLHISSEETN